MVQGENALFSFDRNAVGHYDWDADSTTLLKLYDSTIAGEEYTRIKSDLALGAKFFKFGMVLGIGIRVSKTIANKLWSISGGHLA